ncbi:MAG: 1,4-dihydroxy-2-naphthoate prenyltransferase [Deltaproteobacteria bacterium HGW-Deltaproteobacteria-10]|nr:MAG: 1,4-dihydroxy-2-naphthoate prenyltransferase [Deltaproteobacteria bacterium HGW-Deltaproteobacteria-10]
MINNKIGAWIQASRVHFFVATFIPLFIGWILAIKEAGQIHAGRFLLVLAGSLIVHLITNLANDYFEHDTGTDAGEAIGGSRVIQEGKIAPQTILKVIIALYIIAFIIALIIIFYFRLYLLSLPILFAAFSSYFYVAPPIRYGYHGLGELFVGINMGPIMVTGTYWVIAGHPGWTPFLISLPVGLMVALILYYQSLPDMKTDFQSHKYTLAVRLGKKGAYGVLLLFFFLIYLSFFLLIVAGLLSWWSLGFLLSLPLIIKLCGIIKITTNWVLLDQHGKYVRMIYFICGLAIIAGII